MRRIKNSLSAKVFLWVMCALTLCSFLIYAIVARVIPRQYTTLTNARVVQDVARLAEELDGVDFTTASAEIYNFCIENHTTAMLICGDQIRLFGESAGIEEPGNTASISAPVRFSDAAEEGTLTIICSASAAEEIVDTFLKMLPFVAVVIVLISALSAWFCSRIIVRPVLQISQVSERMAQMDMTWHCETKRTDELGTLAESLNTLSCRLRQTMGELEDANRQLRADIAESRMLEKQRRDFFAAASHELKTPVTILKGQLESMALGIGDYKNHEKYLPQTLAAIERMEQLICEILEITKMQSGVQEQSFSVQPLAPLVRACLAEIAPLTAEKQITVDAQRMDEAVCARVSRSLFQKALCNILSNAARYSPPGERIVLCVRPDALTVENTGVTIAEDDLPLLFTAFYRADASRNRESGGSGLGLYIVKTILDLHGFACRIDNTENAVRVTVFLNQS